MLASQTKPIRPHCGTTPLAPAPHCRIDRNGTSTERTQPCLLYKKDLLVIVYVDDVGVAAPEDALLDKFVEDLKTKGFELTREGSFSEFLGIKFEEDKAAGTLQ